MEQLGLVSCDLLHISFSNSALGKSYLIAAISTSLKELARDHGFADPCIRVAPTGIAAFGIRGLTLHASLKIPIRGWDQLAGTSLSTLQQRWTSKKLLILDEKSMIGRSLFGKLDERLRQIFPNHSTEFFGGLSVLLFGDFAQLPPVLDSPLYSDQDTQASAGLSNAGRRAYATGFTQTVTLTTIFRQQGEDPDSIAFRKILQNQRQYAIDDQDFALLQTRMWGNLTNDEKDSFRSVIHLLPTHEDVNAYNALRLAALDMPVARCKAVNIGPGASKASDEDAGGLEKVVLLAEGAQVMITRNLWTSTGLVNGNQGIVRRIFWSDNKNPLEDLPDVVLVEVHHYDGMFTSLF